MLSAEGLRLVEELRESVEAVQRHFGSSTKRDVDVVALGDESRCRRVSSLVRGQLATCIANVLKQGLKPQLQLFDRRFTLWDVVELHLKAPSHSSLPGISLDRAIRALNQHHLLCDVHQRFRALICVGLTEHRLDQWLLVFCQLNARAISHAYHKQAPLRNPIFVDLVVRELQTLSRYPFSLSAEYEFRMSLPRPSPIADLDAQQTAGDDQVSSEEEEEEGQEQVIDG